MSRVSGRDHLFTSLLANPWQKSMQHGSRERSRGTHNRAKIGPGTLLGHPMAPQRVPEASRERPGGILGHPRRAPATSGGSLSAPRDAKKDTRRRPGARRGVQNRRQVASGSEKNMFVSRDSLTKHCRSDFLSICVDFQLFCKVCEPSETS